MPVDIKDCRRSGWLWLHDEILDKYGATIGPIGLAVYLILARFAGKKGTAFPSLERMAVIGGVSKRSVQRALLHLKELGLISITYRTREDNSQTSNVYALLPLPDCLAPQSGGDDSQSPPVAMVTRGASHTVQGGVDCVTTLEGQQDIEGQQEEGPKTPPTPHGGNGVSGFDQFWREYPKKEKKVKARAAWARLHPDAAMLVCILAGLQKWKQSDQWANRGIIPHPEAWLNGRRWEDETFGSPGNGRPRQETTRERMERITREMEEEKRCRVPPTANGPPTTPTSSASRPTPT